MRWWTFELGREGPVSGFRTTAVGEWVESGYDGIRAVFHGEPINARCDQSRRLPRLLRAAPQAGYRTYWNTQDSATPGLYFFLTLDPFRPSQRPFFFCALYLFLSPDLPANPALSTWAPQAKPRLSPVPPVHARMRPLLPRPTS